MKTSAFSLVELLVVVAILALLASLLVPAFNSLARGRQLDQAGQLLVDKIVLARQEGKAKNRDVEVRIVDLPLHSTNGWRGLQLWIADAQGVMAPLGRLEKFSETVLIGPGSSLSPLLTADTNRTGTNNFGGAGSRSWRGFRIRPGIAMDQGLITTNNNFLTVVPANDVTSQPPANFYTIRVNPVTGRVTTYRP